MALLFNYRPTGNDVHTNKGTFKLMVLREGPRGIVAKVKGKGPIVLWNADEASTHRNDSQTDLIDRLEVILNQ